MTENARIVLQNVVILHSEIIKKIEKHNKNYQKETQHKHK